MKLINTLFALTFVGLAILMTMYLPIGRGMSVRENVLNTPSSYSWEQWCWYENAYGKTLKEYRGTFTLYGEVKNVGELHATVCD